MNLDLINFRDFLRSLSSYDPRQVLVELLLIGAVVYWIVRFLRGTRGARLLKGIVSVLVTLYLVVNLLGGVFGIDTSRIGYLYERFLLFASLAVIVVFQPELRRALMRLGETKLFRGFGNQFESEIDQLVETAVFCSKRKIGALVALEREVGLGGIAESGTRVNADVSAALLNTIFWPNSPLHDLGVIVSGGRVTYAGVQFPLAESGELEKELGSRHRAAVGMSQESDALVLVVSEESGTISLADHGRLLRGLEADQLRVALTELLGRGQYEPPEDSSDESVGRRVVEAKKEAA